MSEFDKVIEEILNEELPTPTKEEAEKALREIGVLDENNRIKPELQGLFVYKCKDEFLATKQT